MEEPLKAPANHPRARGARRRPALVFILLAAVLTLTFGSLTETSKTPETEPAGADKTAGPADAERAAGAGGGQDLLCQQPPPGKPGSRAERMARDSVVRIRAGARGGKASWGTGFVMGDRGLIVTNAHVVRGSSEVEAELLGKKIRGAVVRAYERVDIAIVQTEGDNPFPALRAAHPDGMREGKRVTTVGFPHGKYGASRGRIKALDFHQGILSTVRSAPGGSGSPLLNERGEVLGVVYRNAPEGTWAIPVHWFHQPTDRRAER